MQCLVALAVLYLNVSLLKTDCSTYIKNWIWGLIATFTLLPVVFRAQSWRVDSWHKHPLVKNLQMYNSIWQDVAAQVDSEYAQLDKFVAHLSGGKRVIVTNSWIISIDNSMVKLVKQEDASLSIVSSVERGFSDQLVCIRVKSLLNAVEPFVVRFNGYLLRDLRSKLRIPIARLDSVVQSVEDRFIMAFEQYVLSNPRYDPTLWQSEGSCIGCYQNEANVKIMKTCTEESFTDVYIGEQLVCSSCNCRPMWCLSCLGRWFASRQNPNVPGEWMFGKSPCPNCRATFCILDVCLPA
uniref:Transmembrane protein 129 n=1 Tax=Trichuris muris TaxID=70415 RepID=A0A5S6QND7_TRIMR